jgi:hypothetical protein
MAGHLACEHRQIIDRVLVGQAAGVYRRGADLANGRKAALPRTAVPGAACSTLAAQSA